MSQISLSPWKELYDNTKNDVVSSTTNTLLNEKLYAKLLISLEGQVLQDVVTRSHLCANGILLLQELVQTYRPKHVPEVLAAKVGEFWSQTKRLPSESVHSYYNHFQELLEALSHANNEISTKSAMHHLIFTLGPEFEPIQDSYRIGSLPTDWQTTHWPTLLILCRDFYHSVNLKGPSTSGNNGTHVLSTVDRNAHHKKVKMWSSQPGKFYKEIEAKQQRYPGLCIYHLTKTHPTEDCSVRKACMQLQLSPKDSSTTSSSNVTVQLRNIKEDLFEDAVSEDLIAEDISDACPNDTNEDPLHYFAQLSNHYLCLAKSNPTSSVLSRHFMRYPVIADSGANFHMFKEKEFFTKIIPATGTVILGDGHTTLPILGVCTVQCKIGENVLLIEGVRYVPTLAESIYSLFVHIKSPGYGLHSSYDQGLFITFPQFQTKGIIGDHDIYIDMQPVNEDSSLDHDSNSSVSNKEAMFDATSICCHINEFQEALSQETNNIDNLLS
jgi:hypothetical protein